MATHRMDPMKPEHGVTEDSVDNAFTLYRKWGRPTQVVLTRVLGDQWDYLVHVSWFMAGRVETSHVFSGLSWGYGGEGPHGLVRVLTLFGFTRNQARTVANTDNGKGGQVARWVCNDDGWRDAHDEEHSHGRTVSAAGAVRCADCGEAGERTGHMGCQYPGRAGG
mgnify:CR=1 FL=1